MAAPGRVESGDADPEIPAEEVRRRFAWARRQGRPAWLWPDVRMDAWRAAQQGIGAVAAVMLAGAPRADLDGEAEAIGLAGYTSGMGPLLGLWLEQGRLRVDEPTARVLARHLAHSRRRAVRLQAAAIDVVGRLADRGIAVVVLKGSHTGPAYFPEPGARPASDIDLLVNGRDGPAAEAVMPSCGLSLKGRSPWESCWEPPAARREPRSLTYVHAEDPWSIDLHDGLNISVGRGTPVAAFGPGRPMAGAVRWGPDPRAGVLDQPLLLLHVAAHAGGGWQNLTLLRQVELVLMIRQDLEAGRLSWPAFLETGDLTGALGYAYPALALAEKLAPGLVPDEVLGHCAARAPAAVRRALARQTPWSAQRIERASVGEHFMWAEGWQGRLRRLAADLLPDDARWPEVRRLYEERAWRLIRGRVSQ